MVIRTETEIEAPAERVWDILTDFDAYPEWNPMIPRIISGSPEVGSKVVFQIALGKRAKAKLNAEVVTVDPERELRWVGPARTSVRRAVHGSHYYRIEPLSDTRVRLVHGEEFGGMFVPRRWRRAESALAPAYKAFNRAIKARAEAA